MSIELSLYKLSDSLQLPFTYRDGKVKGSVERVVKTIVGLDLKVNLKAVKLFANEQVGILAHVMGDLSILVSHFPKTGMVSAYFINNNALYMDDVKAPPELFISKKMSLKEVVGGLQSAIVASFYFKDGWKPLKLPK